MKTHLAVTMLAVTLVTASAVAQDTRSHGQQMEARVNAEMQKKDKFRQITATVDDGIVTLDGTTQLYIDKVNAEDKVRKLPHVDGVRNHIAVDGAEVTDEQLRDTLAGRLRYDRVGYGIIFNSLGLRVENGAVTITGNVRDYPDRNSAIAIVQTTPGVKDVIDDIEVAPVSGFDDELRIRLASAIYGHSSLQQYSLDPQAPIRIVVENGNVRLEGVVLNEMQKNIAGAQANSVSGVFSVTNNLIVENKS